MKAIRQPWFGSDAFDAAIDEAFGVNIVPTPGRIPPKLDERLVASLREALDDFVPRPLTGLADKVSRLQARVGDLEEYVIAQADWSAAAMSGTRSDVEELKTGVARGEHRLQACERRLTEAADHATDQADDIAEAAAWSSIRADTSEMRLGHIETRLATVERDVVIAQSAAENLEGTRAEVAGLMDFAASSEKRVAGLEARLAAANASISDHRSRLACLNAKLAASTDVLRYTVMSQVLRPRNGPGDQAIQIIDLKDAHPALLTVVAA